MPSAHIGHRHDPSPPRARTACHASFLPSRGLADVAPQRSEIRDDLAKHFTDAGTAAPSSATRSTIIW